MDNRFSSMYTVGDAGLRRSNDQFQKMAPGEEFARLISGLDPLIEDANHIKAHAEDLEVYGKDLRPIVDSDGIKLMVGDRPFHLTEWSFGQFAGKVGIPKDYAISMVKAGKFQLFLDNFNSWLETHTAGKKFLVRTFDDHLRGILSDRYEPVDADFMLPQLRSGLATSNMDFKVAKSILNPEYTNVRIISNRQIDIGGDPHYAGFEYSSSDVGKSSLNLSFFVFRSVCTNGMFFGKHGGTLIHKTHTFKEFVKDGHFEEHVAASLGKADHLVEVTTFALRNAKAKTLTGSDIQSIIDRFQGASGFGKKSTEALFGQVKSIIPAYGDKVTLWSVTNALTEVAQTYHVDRAQVIEDFAGNLLFSKLQVA